MSDDDIRAEIAALRAQVADLKETVTAVQMSAFDICSVIINALMIATSRFRRPLN